jgi:hypothetical protein
MFESTFWRIVKPSTLGPCQGGTSISFQTKPKKYGVQLIEVFFKNNLCKLGVCNLVLNYTNFLLLFRSISKKKFHLKYLLEYAGSGLLMVP